VTGAPLRAAYAEASESGYGTHARHERGEVLLVPGFEDIRVSVDSLFG
jgi:hypothetical protein